MALLQNFSLAKKLSLMLLPPIFGVLVLSSFHVRNAFNHYEQAQESVVMSEQIKLIGNVIHELQKERGLSVGYVTGSTDDAKLASQRQLSQNALQMYQENYPDPLLFKEIQKCRDTVNAKSLPAEVAGGYTQLIAKGMGKINTLGNQIRGELSIHARTYLTLAQFKEIRGQTRAFVNGILGKNSVSQEELYKLAGMNARFGELEKSFEVNAPEEIEKIYLSKVKGIVETQETQKIIEHVLATGIAGNFHVEPKVWFKTITAQIDGQRGTENGLLSFIAAQAQHDADKARNELLTVFLASIVGFIITVWIAVGMIRSLTFSLKSIEKGILEFFQFLNHKVNHAKPIQVLGKDEFGLIAQEINSNILLIEKAAQADNAMVENTIEQAKKIKMGHLNVRIDATPHTPQLKKLQEVLNEMLLTNHTNVSKIEAVLVEFSQYKFTHRLDAHGAQGDIGQLIGNVNNLGGEVSKMLSLSLESGKTLSSQSSELSHELYSLSSATQQQASNLEDISESINGINGTIQDVASRAAMITRQSHDIKSIIAVIGDIADQTNLLALNAAIEAARAGEHGRGFAVVSDEVRKLAEQTQKSLSEISSNINVLLQALEEVSSSIASQATSIDHVNESINELSCATQNNARISEHISHIAQVVNSLSSTILEEVKKKEF